MFKVLLYQNNGSLEIQSGLGNGLDIKIREGKYDDLRLLLNNDFDIRFPYQKKFAVNLLFDGCMIHFYDSIQPELNDVKGCMDDIFGFRYSAPIPKRSIKDYWNLIKLSISFDNINKE